MLILHPPVCGDNYLALQSISAEKSRGISPEDSPQRHKGHKETQKEERKANFLFLPSFAFLCVLCAFVVNPVN